MQEQRRGEAGSPGSTDMQGQDRGRAPGEGRWEQKEQEGAFP